MLTFKRLTLESKEEILPFFKKREIESCEYNFNTLYLWNDVYKISYYKTNDYLLFFCQYEEEYYTMMPLCEKCYIKEAFNVLYNYFKEDRKIKMNMYVTDEVFANFIEKEYTNSFKIIQDRDSFDYIYDAELLKTLKGKKYHKKRNHINAFLTEYEERFYYESINDSHINQVEEFLFNWQVNKPKESQKIFQKESEGIIKALKVISKLDFKAGGIWIDNKLEALTIGSISNTYKNQAIIHIEKANSLIRGLYPLINQLFLQKEFKDIVTVNREEDLGIEGIRKAKKSYKPIRLATKYHIFEK